MASVSALQLKEQELLAKLSMTQLDESKWSGLHEQMSAKLAKQTKAETAWCDSSSKAEEVCYEEDKELKWQGEIFKFKNETVAQAKIPDIATRYANKAVPNYNPLKLEEYAQLDAEYAAYLAELETLLEEYQAQYDETKSAKSEAAKDTGSIEQ